MNIGIVTFHTAANHGAAWQSLALQEVFKKLGANAEFIQFQPEKDIDFTPDAHLAKRLEKFPRLAKELQKQFEALQARHNLFKKFRAQCLNISALYEDISTINTAYDAFFAGSDQIWNYQLIDNDTNYFLSFAQKHKRFAYAASFGLEDIPKNLLDWYKQYLIDFVQISVREANAVQMVRDIANKNAVHCLDPTLLLTTQEWSDILKKYAPPPSNIEQEYVLLYILNQDLSLIKTAEQLSLEKGLDLQTVSACLIPSLGESAWIDTGVLELLSKISRAKYVVTDSFHGLALSLIFKRPLLLGKMGLNSSSSSRLHNLLQITNLNHITLGLQQEIDWHMVDSCLSKQREISYNYLKDCLKIIGSK